MVLSPETHVFQSEQDYRSFAAFEQGIGVQLYSSLPVELWTNQCLQFSQHNAALKNVVMALGALGKGFQSWKTLSRFLTNDDNGMGNVAQFYYGRALQELRHSLSQDSTTVQIQNALCCLLLTAFEFLCGNEENTIVHIAAGAKIVRTLQRNDRKAITESESSAQSQLVDVYQVFSLAGHVWSNQVFPSVTPNIDFHRVLRTPPPLRQLGGWLPESENDWLCELDYELALIRSAIANLRFSPGLSAAASSMPEAIHVLNFQVAGVRARADLIASQAPNPLNMVCQRVLHLHCLILEHQLAIQVRHERKDDKFEENYLPALEIVEDLLKNHPKLLDRVIYDQSRYHVKDCLEGLEPLFSFVTILIHPLFFIAVHSKVEEVVNRALELLESRQWREGAWDSTVMAIMARKRIKDHNYPPRRIWQDVRVEMMDRNVNNRQLT